MKILLFIFFALINVKSFSQVYVSDIKDARYIDYKDSLKKYLDYQSDKKSTIKLLDDAPDWASYCRISDSLGFHTTQLPTTTDNKFMYDDKKKSHIYYELATCFHSTKGDISCQYMALVPKPTIVVIYFCPDNIAVKHTKHKPIAKPSVKIPVIKDTIPIQVKLNNSGTYYATKIKGTDKIHIDSARIYTYQIKLK